MAALAQTPVLHEVPSYALLPDQLRRPKVAGYYIRNTSISDAEIGRDDSRFQVEVRPADNLSKLSVRPESARAEFLYQDSLIRTHGPIFSVRWT